MIWGNALDFRFSLIIGGNFSTWWQDSSRRLDPVCGRQAHVVNFPHWERESKGLHDHRLPEARVSDARNSRLDSRHIVYSRVDLNRGGRVYDAEATRPHNVCAGLRQAT